MTTCCYLRVSSKLQADANGTQSQRDALTYWLKGRGLDPEAAVWFEDLAVSGKSMNRPEWEAMNARIEAGEFDTVLIYDISRAGRTLRGLVNWVGGMVEREVRIVFVKDSLDLDSAMGRLIFNIMGSVAEFMREKIADTIRDGVKSARRDKFGGKWGSQLKKPKFSPEQEAEIQAALKGGESPWMLAKRLGVQYRTIKKRAKTVKA